MRFITISSMVSSVLIIAACHTTKKTTTSTNKTSGTNSISTATTTAIETATIATVAPKPADGIYEPGNEELSAINVTYKDVTLEKLKEGHKLYTAQTCTRCHNSLNIYYIPSDRWENIMDRMAYKAGITGDQRDAVVKYVLAVKAAKK